MKSKYTSLATITAALLLLAGCGQNSSNTHQGAAGDASVRSSGSSSSQAVNSPSQETTGTGDKDADNTGVNKRDRDNSALTSGDQAGNKSDRELTRKIRREITKNKDLSTTAKNIKIIAQNGKVTLRGPVKTEEERNSIVTAATTAAGEGQVDNQLEVKQTTEKTDK